MSKEATKKFIGNNGFICNRCAKVVVDGTKHKNEEDLCDQCKIADLETKLAEKEKEIFFYQNVIKKKPKTATEMCELLRPYELKLRENEMYKDRFESLYNHYNQDKISFCIEQLLKAKFDVLMLVGLVQGGTLFINSEHIRHYIDNQIKQLKEGK